MAREGEGEDYGQHGLHAEIDGEGGLLELGEGGTWQGLEGDNAADEGLEDGGAEEGAIAGMLLADRCQSGMHTAYLRMWYGGRVARLERSGIVSVVEGV